MSRFEEIRNDYCDGEYYHIDAWEHGKEEGRTIAVINARNGDVYFVDNMAIGDAEVNAAIGEVKKNIAKNNPHLVLMVVDSDDNTCLPYITTDYDSIGSNKLLNALVENIPHYIGMGLEKDVEEVKNEVEEAAKELYESSGSVVSLHGYELYWEEVALV